MLPAPGTQQNTSSQIKVWNSNFSSGFLDNLPDTCAQTVPCHEILGKFSNTFKHLFHFVAGCAKMNVGL